MQQLEASIVMAIDTTGVARSRTTYDGTPTLDDMNILSGLVIVGRSISPIINPFKDNQPLEYGTGSDYSAARQNDVPLTGNDASDPSFATPIIPWQLKATGLRPSSLRDYSGAGLRGEMEGDANYFAMRRFAANNQDPDGILSDEYDVPLVGGAGIATGAVGGAELVAASNPALGATSAPVAAPTTEAQPPEERRADEYHDRRGPGRLEGFVPGQTRIDGQLMEMYEGALYPVAPVEPVPPPEPAPVTTDPLAEQAQQLSAIALLGRETAATENEITGVGANQTASGFPLTPQRPEEAVNILPASTTQAPTPSVPTQAPQPRGVPGSPFAPPAAAIVAATKTEQALQVALGVPSIAAAPAAEAIVPARALQTGNVAAAEGNAPQARQEAVGQQEVATYTPYEELNREQILESRTAPQEAAQPRTQQSVLATDANERTSENRQTEQPETRDRADLTGFAQPHTYDALNTIPNGTTPNGTSLTTPTATHGHTLNPNELRETAQASGASATAYSGINEARNAGRTETRLETRNETRIEPLTKETDHGFVEEKIRDEMFKPAEQPSTGSQVISRSDVIESPSPSRTEAGGTARIEPEARGDLNTNVNAPTVVGPVQSQDVIQREDLGRGDARREDVVYREALGQNPQMPPKLSLNIDSIDDLAKVVTQDKPTGLDLVRTAFSNISDATLSGLAALGIPGAETAYQRRIIQNRSDVEPTDDERAHLKRQMEREKVREAKVQHEQEAQQHKPSNGHTPHMSGPDPEGPAPE